MDEAVYRQEPFQVPGYQRGVYKFSPPLLKAAAYRPAAKHGRWRAPATVSPPFHKSVRQSVVDSAREVRRSQWRARTGSRGEYRLLSLVLSLRQALNRIHWECNPLQQPISLSQAVEQSLARGEQSWSSGQIARASSSANYVLLLAPRSRTASECLALPPPVPPPAPFPDFC